MKKGLLIILAVIAGLILLVGGWFVGKYNAMVTGEQEVENKQAQVEVQLQRRYDLIPNLVNSVKGSMTQEQTVFGDIADARTRYTGATSGTSDKVEASNELESAIGRLLVIIENYPELKSNETVVGLMDELAGTENRVAVERRRYNDEVTTFNNLIKTFPNNLFAGLFGFEEKVRFEAAEGAETAPEVNLSLK